MGYWALGRRQRVGHCKLSATVSRAHACPSHRVSVSQWPSPVVSPCPQHGLLADPLGLLSFTPTQGSLPLAEVHGYGGANSLHHRDAFMLRNRVRKRAKYRRQGTSGPNPQYRRPLLGRCRSRGQVTRRQVRRFSENLVANGVTYACARAVQWEYSLVRCGGRYSLVRCGGRYSRGSSSVRHVVPLHTKCRVDGLDEVGVREW